MVLNEHCKWEMVVNVVLGRYFSFSALIKLSAQMSEAHARRRHAGGGALAVNGFGGATEALRVNVTPC